MHLLEVVDGHGKKRQIPLDRPHVLIGREPSCDIHLAHPAVSRRHAQLQKTDQGRWVLQDLSSRNRVYVDDKPVQQLVLEPRQAFRIAEYRLRLIDPALPQLDSSAEESPSADLTGDTGLVIEGAWMESLHAFQRGLVALEDPQAAWEALAREARRVARPTVLAIGLSGSQGYAWEIVQAEEYNAPLRDYLDDADSKVHDEPSSVYTWSSTRPDVNRANPPGACVLIPLRGRQTILGHLYVNRPASESIPAVLQRYLGLIATYAALAHENLLLNQMRNTHLDFEKELQHARQIQIDLFPDTFDLDKRLDAFAVNLPSARVSGDYYDLIRIDPDRVAFVIADAMGHGMPAALLMAAVRAGLRMGLTLTLPWEAVFRGLDDLIHQARNETFVTGVVGLLDLALNELAIVSAGHPLPSILIDGVPVVIPEICQTRPWGIDLEMPWEVGHVSLQGKRWSILGFTDGVTECAVQGQRSFGFRRVAQFHQKNFHLSAEDIGQKLLNEVAASHGAGPLGDDQTVLVLCSGGK